MQSALFYGLLTSSEQIISSHIRIVSSLVIMTLWHASTLHSSALPNDSCSVTKNPGDGDHSYYFEQHLVTRLVYIIWKKKKKTEKQKNNVPICPPCISKPQHHKVIHSLGMVMHFQMTESMENVNSDIVLFGASCKFVFYLLVGKGVEDLVS